MVLCLALFNPTWMHFIYKLKSFGLGADAETQVVLSTKPFRDSDMDESVFGLENQANLTVQHNRNHQMVSSGGDASDPHRLDGTF